MLLMNNLAQVRGVGPALHADLVRANKAASRPTRSPPLSLTPPLGPMASHSAPAPVGIAPNFNRVFFFFNCDFVSNVGYLVPIVMKCCSPSQRYAWGCTQAGSYYCPHSSVVKYHAVVIVAELLLLMVHSTTVYVSLS